MVQYNHVIIIIIIIIILQLVKLYNNAVYAFK
jgi:hypothetical protein